MNSAKSTVAACAVLIFFATSVTFAGTLKRVPPPLRIQPLQLSRPFTLTYKVAAQFYNNGTMVPHRLRTTLSYDGVHLLYRSQDAVTRVTHTVLYDGHETYEADSNSPLAEIEPGFDFSRMLVCPLPGVGLPYLPLFSDGIPPRTLPVFLKQLAPGENSEPRYIAGALYRTPGKDRDYGAFQYCDQEAMAHLRSFRAGIASAVTAPDSGVPKVLWYDTFDNAQLGLGTIWEFYGHTRFQDLWIATKIRMRWYGTVAPGKDVLLQSAAYDLGSAADHALEPSAYDPTTYLPTHANISDMTGLTVRAFIYQRGKGSLQAQRQGESQVPAALAMSAKSRTNSGLIGLIVVSVMLIAWFVWRRRRA